LEPVRAEARKHDQSCHLKSGASVFVYPNQYDAILSALKGHFLKAHHVVVSEAFLPLIYLEVVKIPSKSNVKPIKWTLWALADDETTEEVCCVERTFSNIPVRQRCNASDVTQSTSEAHRSPNPRRIL